MLVAQVLTAQPVIEARVIDHATLEPLPYATVMILGTTRGTITNAEGRFRVSIQREADSLRISYIGYNTLMVPLSDALDGRDIAMRRAVHVLREAIIRPDEDLYKRFVAASNWLRRAPEVRSKLYISLETYSDEQPVEVLEAYFNASFKGASLRNMTFKQGVIGIAPKGEYYFINYNTAAAFVLMDIHAESDRFPTSPFAFQSSKALRDRYLVTRVSTSTDPDDVDHLRAIPCDSTKAGLAADIWLLVGSTAVRGLELQCTNCPRHPFIPLFDEGKLDTVDLRYAQTWSTTDPPFPEVMELEYRVAYSGPRIHDHFRTHAVLHAFDRGQQFIPTLFPWKQGLEEYPMIAWMPRDTAFWERMSPPLPTERQNRDRELVLRNDVANNSWFEGLRLNHPHLRPHYLAWSPDRWIDSTHLSGVPVDRPHDGKRPPNVNLRTHLYLDLDTTGGTLHHRTLAVFESGGSWYLYPWEPWASAYCTIYFDLCEIERRALEERLNEPGITLELARRLYDEHTQRMKDQQKRFVMSVESQLIQLRSWNVRVRDKLGVDRLRGAEIGGQGTK